MYYRYSNLFSHFEKKTSLILDENAKGKFNF